MIVGLTSSARVNPYASLLIDELARGGVNAAFVLSAERGVVGDLWARLQRRGIAGVLRAARRRASPALGPAPLAATASERGLALWAPLAANCSTAGVEHVRVSGLHEAEAVEAVRERHTEVLINAGGGLFRRRLVAAPRLGVLNAHMARLPNLRGVDVLEWSLLLGEQPGVTVHWIDSGIDTGGVLAFEPLTPVVGDTLETLRERATLLSARVVATQVERLSKGQAEVRHAAGEAPQYFSLHLRLRARAAAILARGALD